ncbi:uncharacterized protein SOCE26_042040 [Sorangium cellulosum]|uniref:N-acetyltransferase domain-containing protein n=1 Tax=Sorangium cellulosum TaxID=56 RepID=A0A2L0EU01_SORCE|nr:hypothetical protein [Sorangium cellulosum]AUX42770.1 uncharacterized protein SOCE26_042040 [Sorangium cellulosum]
MSGSLNDEVLLRLAEAPSAYDPIGDGERLIVTNRYVLFLGRGDDPGFNTVQHLRLSPPAVDKAVDEVRALASKHGRRALTWEVASSARPPDLAGRLRAFGMVPAEPPLAVVMALLEPPPRAPAGVAVSRVETVGDFRTFVSITHEVFGKMDRLADELARIDREGARDLADTRFVRYLAWIDGDAVAAAAASFTNVGAVLHSGGTKAAARGRGAYRALVAARWDDAVRRGTPRVVTRAGPMSCPILGRTGFQKIAEIELLVDRFG